ncbi:magnesium transporter [Aequitasia blattaphilus]|uniref:Magnesium and cobalt transporter CorA n=1 Tax=Aequitasia blattaphilus TaxID=2949332 RepID=A0ABT1E6X4_9FIRM|nr:CorA family divalent cation transporter [Aequitasia blattaphilus]MCP1101588.1 magnesium and cobalt transporter CorA [Aequitasia blattaphilus]MCR8614228.1 magnesium and cobalt transporter CorA [Aequitasia blattaphilus]
MIETYGVETYLDKIKDRDDYFRLKVAFENTKNSKIELLEHSVAGVLLIPQKEELLEREIYIGYHVTRDNFVLIGDDEDLLKMSQVLEQIKEANETNTMNMLFWLMEYIIKDDFEYLQDFEARLNDLEEMLLERESKNFDKDVLTIRKELLRLQFYYQQLIDIADTLVENHNLIINDVQTRLFDLYSRRVDRLFDTVNRLKEYTIQLRELYQSQIDLRQNEIMKVLTVVTSLIMPLTLITGWYGMNFRNMPELENQHGYFTIIVLSLVIIVIEILIFKFKNWFK